MGEPLVLLPGMNCSARLWGSVEPRLRRAEACPEVLHAELAEPSLDACVAALLDTLPPRFALAGLSLGGIVAMALVRRAPERVSRLCLLSTNARGPRPDQVTAWAGQRRALAEGTTARDLQRELLPVLLHTRTPELEAETLAMADEVGEEVLGRQLALQATRVDELPGLAAVRVPTRVVAAEADLLCPLERHREIVERIPGARLAVLTGVGHLSPLEAPEAVADELLDWLAQE